MTEAFFQAIRNDDAATVESVLADKSRVDIDERDAEGLSGLHLAAQFGLVEIARKLLQNGADPNAVAFNDSRATPLHVAVSARHRDLAGLLLAHGASANVIQKGGLTPLHTAAANGDEEVVSLLLLRGANPMRLSDQGQTAIDMAAQNGHGALAEMLRESVQERFVGRGHSS